QQRKQREEARQAEIERKRREQQEGDRKRQELTQLQTEGESRLVQLIREALDRTQGKPAQNDTTAFNEICKQYGIPTEKGRLIVDVTKAQWQKVHPSIPGRKHGEIITNTLGMKFAWIPPGPFLMGRPNHHIRQHKVTLTKGFCMGIYTVTQEQWERIMGNNPSFFTGGKNLPVEKVSWDDCQA